tara:strand:+ start:8 stop:568 length:561 start_codon:yes stop_codon:yes gene_type:complete
MTDVRLDRLDEEHVRPLMSIIRSIRERGLRVPNVDPEDGGTGAVALFLLETPGPKAVNSDFISRDNDDPSARNMRTELARAGFARSEVVLWNVVPHCLSTEAKNKNATSGEIRASLPDTQRFIDALPGLRVVVFCGRKAQRARPRLRLPAGLHALDTFHPGAMAYNHQRCRQDIAEKFGKARELSR